MTYKAHEYWYAQSICRRHGLVIAIGDTEQDAAKNWRELYERIEREWN